MNDARPRGRLTVFLSYAAGAGKTFSLLTRGHQLRRQAVDVVIGFINVHAYGRQETIALARGLERVPTRSIVYRGRGFREMDTDAILARHPQLVLVDELPHTNAPGSPRAKRWEDVQLLRDAGIDVMTTMNVQHLESLGDRIRQVTGVRMRETVPDVMLQEADDVVMVDVPPRILLRRLQRGESYPPQRARAERTRFFKASALLALRELAKQYAGHVVEADAFDDVEDVDDVADAGDIEAPVERLLVVIEADPASAVLLARARHLADQLNGQCYALFVTPVRGGRELTPEEREVVDRQLYFARGLQFDTHVLEGEDVADVVTNFARLYDVTHLFILRHVGVPYQRSQRLTLRRRRLLRRILRLAGRVQVSIVSATST